MPCGLLQVGTGSTVGHPASLLPALSLILFVQELGKAPTLLSRAGGGGCLAPPGLPAADFQGCP